MPKIIDDVKNSIVREAQKQVLESGYANMTIRSVAKGCGIAVGTIYNYFPSKDMMTAAFMLEDWLAALAAMERGCKDADGPRDAFRAVYAELTAYTDKYRRLFEDSAATKSLGGAFYAR
ncbi:MAG: TetR/AcrR family transcriptional regulator, partial [Ruminococcaceae bacterium]|nr:TetR/AcrR family transcriptional regulator [Oscillospiraceae bacterium]